MVWGEPQRRKCSLRSYQDPNRQLPATDEESSLSRETYREMVERTRISNRTVRRAEKENRKHGVPTVYLIRNHIYYERPDGTLNRQDRFSDDERSLSGAGTVDCVLNTLTAQFAGFSLGDENIGHQSTVQLSRTACARYTKVLRVCASDL